MSVETDGTTLLTPSTTITEPGTPQVKKVSEFNDGRKTPHYSMFQSTKDWFKQSFSPSYQDETVEARLLSHLPFFPDSDSTRRARVINTDIGNGHYIHELFIENTNKATPGLPGTNEVVLVHGYAASLGLFIDNFDSLSQIPGIKIHAIDLLGFGLSSRPKFPDFPSSTKEDVYRVEDWFIDSFETWRKKRNIGKFILMGHSFGGYLSCAYALKYNKKIMQDGILLNLIEKMVLISPVGLERSEAAFKHDKGDRLERQVTIEQEVMADQEAIVNGEGVVSTTQLGPEVPKTKTRKLIDYMWERNHSPFTIIRNAGPFKSKLISTWTCHRFSHVYYQNPEHFNNIHAYIYRVFNGPGSGEYAITRVLAVGALAKLPLMDRCPEKFVKMKLPTLWLYGDKDWMNDEAGLEMTNTINDMAKKKYHERLANFKIISNAGHHLYLDNPPEFAKVIYKFLKVK
ncbi:putative cardiolipin-specific deacylase, mitochondrial [Candida viswanathii]|uniref:Putative cardiolipin-specific deacylase, mitochondrial n=1 Tax=Candida viswanathii TaxID=5486 RepID=A0A367YIH0_9ASCO|nr:putative cardiolipin-specific deacylase, mitochondrial [Candida viswanathii]